MVWVWVVLSFSGNYLIGDWWASLPSKSFLAFIAQTLFVFAAAIGWTSGLSRLLL